MRIETEKKIFEFNFPAGTSRGVLHNKTSWFIKLYDKNSRLVAIGECSVIEGLSIDDLSLIEEKLDEILINDILEPDDITTLKFTDFPALQFALDMIRLQLNNGRLMVCYDNDFTTGIKGIPINGLIWMGDSDFMIRQIDEKTKNGADCLKLKVGSNSLDEELRILKAIREKYSPERLEIRLDANGAFKFKNVLEILKKYAEYSIHSIEQPLPAGQRNEMAEICQKSPIPIALDEEMITIQHYTDKKTILEAIAPQFIILKPSLLGGFEKCNEWIDIANSLNIDWWITSALESNIGLSAIAQYTESVRNRSGQKYHGLGTGQIYKNNIPSPLQIDGFELWNNKRNTWNIQ